MLAFLQNLVLVSVESNARLALSTKVSASEGTNLFPASERSFPDHCGLTVLSLTFSPFADPLTYRTEVCRTHLTTGHCDYGSAHTPRCHREAHSDPILPSLAYPPFFLPLCCVQHKLSVCAWRHGAAQPRIRLQVQNRSEAALGRDCKERRRCGIAHSLTHVLLMFAFMQSCARITICSVRSRASSLADASSFVSHTETAVPAALFLSRMVGLTFFFSLSSCCVCADDEYRLRASEFEFWLVSPAGPFCCKRVDCDCVRAC